MVDGAALEKRWAEMPRGFESHPLRGGGVKMTNKYSFPPRLNEWVNKFFKGLKDEPKFRKDTIGHSEAVQMLNRQVFSRLDELRLEEFRHCITETGNVMKVKPNHWESILNEIDNDFPRVKRYLKFIRDFDGKTADMQKLLDRGDSLHIRGAGLFFITQLLAGAHLDQYVVFHDNMYEALRHLEVIDIGAKIDTGSRYVVINAICKWLYEEKFKQRMRVSYKLGLQSVHNFLWHYHYHQIKGKGRWWKEDC